MLALLESPEREARERAQRYFQTLEPDQALAVVDASRREIGRLQWIVVAVVGSWLLVMIPEGFLVPGVISPLTAIVIAFAFVATTSFPFLSRKKEWNRRSDLLKLALLNVPGPEAFEAIIGLLSSGEGELRDSRVEALESLTREIIRSQGYFPSLSSKARRVLFNYAKYYLRRSARLTTEQQRFLDAVIQHKQNLLLPKQRDLLTLK